MLFCTMLMQYIQEIEAILKVCKLNVVALRLAGSGLMTELSVEVDTSVHPTMPVFKLR